MDLIDDLGTELAMAILVERRLSDRLDEREARTFISRVRAALENVSEDRKPADRPYVRPALAGSES